MNTPTKFEKEVRRTLDILIKNYRVQAPENIKAKEIDLEIYLDDVDAYDSENVHPFVFCDTVRTLKKEGVKVDEYDHDAVLSDSMKYGSRHTPFCKVTVPANFEATYERLTGNTGAKPDKRRLIEKDLRGDYFYDGKPIQLSKNTLPFKVLDALCSAADQDGYLSYEEIEKYFVKSGESESSTDEERNKRIINAVSESQGLFRYAKVNKKPLQNKTLNGSPLIEIQRGAGLRLNNPTI